MLLHLRFKLSTLCRQLEAVCVARRFFLCYTISYDSENIRQGRLRHAFF